MKTIGLGQNSHCRLVPIQKLLVDLSNYKRNIWTTNSSLNTSKYDGPSLLFAIAAMRADFRGLIPAVIAIYGLIPVQQWADRRYFSCLLPADHYSIEG